MRFTISLFILRFALSVILTQQDKLQNNDMQKFLENIKQSNQKIKKLKDSKIRNPKSSIKKNLVQKLSSPTIKVFSHQLLTISYQLKENKKLNSDSRKLVVDSNSLTREPLNTSTIRTINKVLRDNPNLMPFKFPDLKQFLKSNSKLQEYGECIIHNITTTIQQSEQGQSNYNPTIRWDYLELLYKCYLQLSQKRESYCNSINISKVLAQFYTRVNKYINFAKEIYSKHILPTIYDMCYNKCSCKDIGVYCNDNNINLSGFNEEQIISLFLPLNKTKIDSF